MDAEIKTAYNAYQKERFSKRQKDKEKREAYNAYHRKWYAENKERAKEIQAKYWKKRVLGNNDGTENKASEETQI